MKKNQYIIYGTLVSNKWYEEFKIRTKDDNTFPISEKLVGSITPVYNSRDGEFVIIGEVLLETDTDKFIAIPEINENRQKFVKNRVYTLYGINGDFNYFYVKNI